MRVSRHEVEELWSIDDMAEAHLALDLAEDMETLLDSQRERST